MIHTAFKVWRNSNFAQDFYGTFGQFYAAMIRKFAFDGDEANIVKFLHQVEQEIDEMASWTEQ